MELLWIHDLRGKFARFETCCQVLTTRGGKSLDIQKSGNKATVLLTHNTPRKRLRYDRCGATKVSRCGQPSPCAHALCFLCKCSRLMMGEYVDTQQRSISFYLHCWASLYQIQRFPSVRSEVFAHTEIRRLNKATKVQTSLHLKIVCACKKKKRKLLLLFCLHSFPLGDVTNVFFKIKTCEL